VSFTRGQLHYFVTVAEEGQITRAARSLHVAQPALSHAIAQLESELGIRLLERHPRGVTLTRAGATFLPKAQAALAAYAEVSRTAQSLARVAEGALEVGFIGPPPLVNAPELFRAFDDLHPEAKLSFRELPFPRGAPASWLEEVDVAFCHPPPLGRGVRAQAVRVEPRVVVAPSAHPLAKRGELAVAEVLDETYISYHPMVQPVWAGFHTLDDHRGRRPAAVTDHRVLTAPEMLAAIASRQAITALPASDARIVRRALRHVVAIPLSDAAPAVLSLLWREDAQNPLVPALVALAEKVAEGGQDGHRPAARGGQTARKAARRRPSRPQG
jgi:DNA-binding transcriptional LysR family regulator